LWLKVGTVQKVINKPLARINQSMMLDELAIDYSEYLKVDNENEVTSLKLKYYCSMLR